MSGNIAVVTASPSKLFFVSMLTRDIDLKDAILDLLDNCIDGLLRDQRGKSSTNKPYDGYWARITASPTEFTIADNCGGIPRELAINSAFRLGRSDLTRDSDLPTVGMYGIGMKRALFKMGKRSRVDSQHQGDSYYVEIPPEWLNDDDNWRLDLTPTTPTNEPNGTRITVTDLHPNIAGQFNKVRNTFLDDLDKDISNLFAVIIKKGFTVYLNDRKIEPADFVLLFPTNFKRETGTSIRPYAYEAIFEGVRIEVVIGFYRELASDSEAEGERHIPRKSDNAGWTVICNDRVVLYRDKTSITGWGIRDVPQYHTQFIAIVGVVNFSSNDSYKLPLNTTKRGLDTSSPVYLHALNRMMEGLKQFTDFTNRWKGRQSETTAAFRTLTPRDATQVANSIPEEVWRPVRGGGEAARRFTPDLPRPSQDNENRRISFYRPKDEIELLGRYFFDDVDAEPSDVGIHCFEDALKQARKEIK